LNPYVEAELRCELHQLVARKSARCRIIHEIGHFRLWNTDAARSFNLRDLQRCNASQDRRPKVRLGMKPLGVVETKIGECPGPEFPALIQELQVFLMHVLSLSRVSVAA
jgi:hypothetical protein